MTKNNDLMETLPTKKKVPTLSPHAPIEISCNHWPSQNFSNYASGESSGFMVLHNYFPSSLLHISSQQLSLIRKRYCLIGISATHSWSQAKEDITRKAKGNPRCNPPEKGGLNMIKLLYKCLIVPVQREVHAIAMIYIDLCLGDRGMTYQWLLRS